MKTKKRPVKAKRKRPTPAEVAAVERTFLEAATLSISPTRRWRRGEPKRPVKAKRNRSIFAEEVAAEVSAPLRRQKFRIITRKPWRWKGKASVSLTPDQIRIAALRTAAANALDVMHGMVAASAIRLPYHGLFDAMVDLKRALAGWKE